MTHIRQPLVRCKITHILPYLVHTGRCYNFRLCISSACSCSFLCWQRTRFFFLISHFILAAFLQRKFNFYPCYFAKKEWFVFWKEWKESQRSNLFLALNFASFRRDWQCFVTFLAYSFLWLSLSLHKLFAILFWIIDVLLILYTLMTIVIALLLPLPCWTIGLATLFFSLSPVRSLSCASLAN